ncbi:hypothetical protein ACFSTA_04610 [Ornithinibacillus salinisoli]|uniref:Uncharacterized protein n=1 Tax=Ornithinibacillus salinisoli TaxID=1848459 RepID=A0ABW4VYL1_9BACI
MFCKREAYREPAGIEVYYHGREYSQSAVVEGTYAYIVTVAGEDDESKISIDNMLQDVLESASFE